MRLPTSNTSGLIPVDRIQLNKRAQKTFTAANKTKIGRNAFLNMLIFLCWYL